MGFLRLKLLLRVTIRPALRKIRDITEVTIMGNNIINQSILSYCVSVRIQLIRMTLLVLLLVSGCATNTGVLNHELNSVEAMPIGSFLVVAIGEDRATVGLFERIVVTKLTGSGAQAMSLTEQVGTDKEITRELVTEEAKRISADAVLVVSLKSIQLDQKQTKDRLPTARGGSSDGFFFRYEYSELTAPIEHKTTTDVVLTSRLYRVADGLRLWRIDTKGYTNELNRTLMFENAELIVTQLVEDGLVK